MKTLRSILFIVCAFGVCSKGVVHTWRHFHPSAVTTTSP